MSDVIHKPPPRSIYVRTDYIVNSDMSIPDALAGSWRFGVASEIARRSGLPLVDRTPEQSSIVLRRPTIPKGK